MTNVDIPINYRISKTTKKLMIAVGVLFDLMPMLLIAIMMLVTFNLFGSNWAVNDYIYHSNKASEWCAYSKAHPYNIFAKERCFHHTRRAKNSTYYAGGILAFQTGGAGLVGLFVGPIIYTAGSFISTFMAYLLFFFWFGFKRVNMWSFKNEKRILTNIGTSIIEGIPVLNLLPGITLMVWIHIKLSQNEDIENAKEENVKMKRTMRNLQTKPAYV